MLFLILFLFNFNLCKSENEFGLCPLRGEFSSERFPVTAEFWRPGVQHSKDMLDEILEKITLFEKTKILTNVLIDEANKLREQLSEDGVDVETDQSIRIAINTGNICTQFTDIPSATILREVDFSCAEEEQLYGISSQRLYEPSFCRDDALLSKLVVAWDVCLAHHFPWVETQSTRICIVKTKFGDFVACYCNKEGDGEIVRSFCISKLECFIAQSGVNAVKEPTALSADCEEQLVYLVEGSSKERDWFVKAQKRDKLRPRGPYSKFSRCYGTNFSGHFDIGQLMLDDLNNELEILTPFSLIQAEQEEQEKLSKSSTIRKINQDDLIEIIEDDINMEHIISEETDGIFSERVLCGTRIELIEMPSETFILDRIRVKIAINIVIVGVLGFPQAYIRALYSAQTISESWPLIIINKLTGASVVAMKMSEMSYHAYSFYWQPDQPTSDSSTMLYNLAVWYLVTWAYTNSDVVFYCWKLAAITLLVDIVMVQLTLTEYVAIEFYHWILVLEFFFSIIKIKYLSANFKCDESPNESENEKQESSPRKRTKRPNNSQNYNNHNVGNNSPTLRCSRVKETKKVRAIVEISCLAHVTGSSSVSYVSLTCSAKCLLLYHQTCWKALLDSSNRKSDREMLGESCFTPNCWGFIRELSWFDLYGSPTHKKLTHKDPKPKQSINKETTKNKSGPTKKKITRQRTVSFTSASPSSSSSSSSSSTSSITTSSVTYYTNIDQGYSTDQSSRPSYGFIYQSRHDGGMFGELRDPNEKLTLPVGMPKKKKKQQKLNIPSAKLNLSSPPPEDNLFEPRGLQLPFNLYNNEFTANLDYYEVGGFDPIGTPAKTESKSGSLIRTNSANSSDNPGLPISTTPTLDYISDQNTEADEEAAEPFKGSRSQEGTTFYALSDYPFISPLASILCRDMPWYPPNQVDQHLKTILKRQSTTAHTLDSFRSLLAKEIENEKLIQFNDEDSSEEIFESDEEEDFLLEEADICPICHDPLVNNVTRIVPCSHHFHGGCIEDWFGKDRSCPTCRATVEHLQSI